MGPTLRKTPNGDQNGGIILVLISSLYVYIMLDMYM